MTGTPLETERKAEIAERTGENAERKSETAEQAALGAGDTPKAETPPADAPRPARPDDRRIVGAVLMNGRLFHRGDELALAQAMYGRSVEHLLARKAIAGDWTERTEEAPPGGGQEPAARREGRRGNTNRRRRR